MYFTGDAKLWWRTRQADDARAGRTTFGSWDEFQKELRDCPKREKLAALVTEGDSDSEPDQSSAIVGDSTGSER